MRILFNLFGKRGPSMVQAVEEAGRDTSIRLVDVRTPGEYAQGHLPGSLLLPLDNLRSAPELLPDKDAQIYVYCLSGARSAAACQMLGRMGYTKVSNIGGIGGYPGPLAR